MTVEIHADTSAVDAPSYFEARSSDRSLSNDETFLGMFVVVEI